MTDPVELLAPAGDLARGRVAVDCGADALYVGAPAFGARERAANSIEDVAALVAYAHRYRVRVHATLNTLLRDDELEAARKLAWDLWDAGVDALVVQDLGLLEVDLPPLPLHASTQCHNADPERVRFLESVGFSRAILARELTLSEIRAVRARTGLGLEVFVHGALCVSYSGQCWMSLAMGGRSGNRGCCAQPCRLPWTLLDGDGHVLARDRHLLSLKDLQRADDLGDLLDAGVTSFKIEGRLKDEGYVANVVAFYRARLDEALRTRGRVRSSSGRSDPGFEPDPKRTFNRGFTRYLLDGRGEVFWNADTPKAVGEPVGEVAAVRGDVVRVRGNVALQAGDGLGFLDAGGRWTGTGVRAVEGDRVTVEDPSGLGVGTRLWRNRDVGFERSLRRARPVRRIAVRLVVQGAGSGSGRDGWAAGGPGWVVRAVDEDGVAVEIPVEGGVPAERPDAARETAARQLARLGDTEFAASEVEIGDAPFLPVARWNGVRRGLVEALRTARVAAWPRLLRPSPSGRVPAPLASLDMRGNVLNHHARRFWEHHGVAVEEPAAEAGVDLQGRVVMTTRLCLREAMGTCPRSGAPAGATPRWLVSPEGRRFSLRFDCGRCVMEVLGG